MQGGERLRSLVGARVGGVLGERGGGGGGKRGGLVGGRKGGELGAGGGGSWGSWCWSSSDMERHRMTVTDLGEETFSPFKNSKPLKHDKYFHWHVL